jgi:hypothetical protein
MEPYLAGMIFGNGRFRLEQMKMILHGLSMWTIRRKLSARKVDKGIPLDEGCQVKIWKA